MTKNAFTALATALECLPPQFDQPWGGKVFNFYFQALDEIPDSDIPVLAKLIGTQFKKRPTPAEIIEKWREVTQPPKRTIADVVAALYEAAKTPNIKSTMRPIQKFVPDPGQEDKIAAYADAFQGAQSQGVIYRAADDERPTGSWVTVMEPTELYTHDIHDYVKNDPILMKVIEAAGGWDSVKHQVWAGLHETRKEIWFIAKSVVEGAEDSHLDSIRLEYQHKRKLAHERLALKEYGEYDEPVEEAA